MSKGINTLSGKIIVYTTSIVLITTIIFTTVSISTLIIFKNYIIRKTEKTFKENAQLNLEKEVLFYAQTLKKAMDMRSSISYMFGKLIEHALNNSPCSNEILSSAFDEISQTLDLREIIVLNSKMKVICHFPAYIDTLSAIHFLEKNIAKIKHSTRRVVYLDFHVNKDNTISYSFVYLAKTKNHEPFYILFDFYPYNIYSLIKTAQLKPYSQRYLWIVNSKGEIIYSPPTGDHPAITLIDRINLANNEGSKLLSLIIKHHLLKGESGVARYRFGKVDKYVGYTYIRKLGWGLGLTLPADMLYAPINKLSRDINRKMLYALSVLSIINTLVVLVSIIVAMRVAKKLTRPIEMTTEAIEAIVHGEKCVKIPSCGRDELGKLTEAVNKLMDLLDKVWKTTDKGGPDA